MLPWSSALELPITVRSSTSAPSLTTPRKMAIGVPCWTTWAPCPTLNWPRHACSPTVSLGHSQVENPLFLFPLQVCCYFCFCLTFLSLEFVPIWKSWWGTQFQQQPMCTGHLRSHASHQPLSWALEQPLSQPISEAETKAHRGRSCTAPPAGKLMPFITMPSWCSFLRTLVSGRPALWWGMWMLVGRESSTLTTQWVSGCLRTGIGSHISTNASWVSSKSFVR